LHNLVLNESKRSVVEVSAATTASLSCLSGLSGLPILCSALPFEIMRVMDGAIDDAQRVPVERGMTFCAKHLRTSFDAINHRGTRGAILRVVTEEFDGFQDLGITRVLGVFLGAFDFAAFAAYPSAAQLAL